MDGSTSGVYLDSFSIRGRVDSLEDRTDEGMEIDGGSCDVHLSRHDARDVQQVLDEFGLPLGIRIHRFEGPLATSLVEHAGAQKLGPPEHRIEWRAQLMGHGREKLILELVGQFGFMLGRTFGSIGTLEQRGGPSQVVLDPFPLGNVGHGRNPADDVASLVTVRRIQRAHEPPSGMGIGDVDFEVDRLAAQHAFDIGRNRRIRRITHDLGDRFADDLLGRTAEEVGAGPIHEHVAAIAVAPCQQQGRAAGDQFELEARGALFLGERGAFPFHALPVGNVAHVCGEQRWPGDSDPRDREFDGQLCPVGAHRGHFDSSIENDRFSSVQVSGEPSVMPISQPRRNDEIGHRLTDDLIPPVAERSLARRIEVDHAALVVHRDDAVERRVQNTGLASLAFDKPFPGIDDRGRSAAPHFVQRH